MKDRMPYREEDKMVQTISAVLKDMGKGKSPEDSVVSAAIAHKLTPSQTTRVCEACNKMSAIQHLSCLDVKVKKSDFPLADPNKVAKRLKDMNKAEHAPVSVRKTASDGIHQVSVEKGLRKILGVTSLDRATLVALDMKSKVASAQKEAQGLVDTHANKELARRRAEARYQDAFADLLVTAEKSSLKQAADLARYLTAGGKHEKGVLKLLYDHLPAYKEASITLPHAFVPTGSILEKKATAVIQAAAKAVAAAEESDMVKKEAIDFLNASLNVAELIREKNSESSNSTDAPPVTANPFSVSTVNRMNELSMKDGFANMYLDDEFLLQYEPKVVLDAYNKVLQMVPNLHQRQNSDALITSMVKKLITSGNQIDPLELPSTTKMEKEIAESRKNSDARAWE